MTSRVLCGLHTLQDTDNPSIFYPVAVYLSKEGTHSNRESGLVSNEKYESLEAALDELEAAIGYYSDEMEDVLGQMYTEKEILDSDIKLDRLTVYYPSRERLGETLSGTIVGWHVDLKTNSKKPNRPACLFANVSWMDSEGNVYHTIVRKEPIPNISDDDVGQCVALAFKIMAKEYRLGSTVTVDVVPVGKKAAKFNITELTPSLTFMEEVCQALNQCR